MREAEDVAPMVITLMIADDFHAADSIIAEAIDGGHGDMLVEGLCEYVLSLLDVISESTPWEPDEVWRKVLLRIESEHG